VNIGRVVFVLSVNFVNTELLHKGDDFEEEQRSCCYVYSKN